MFKDLTPDLIDLNLPIPPSEVSDLYLAEDMVEEDINAIKQPVPDEIHPARIKPLGDILSMLMCSLASAAALVIPELQSCSRSASPQE